MPAPCRVRPAAQDVDRQGAEVHPARAGERGLTVRAIILDFDGVVADSEPVANRALATLLTAHGAPTTLTQSYARYVGKRAAEVVAAAEARHGVALPADFERLLSDATLDRFRAELRPVPGARRFLATFRETPKAVASSSSPARLALSLDVLGLAEAFGRHVYSAELVPRGKPAPDVFLHAAAALGVAPADCVVVEDSPSGVQAGVAAGMRVVGLLAGGHIQPGHAARLEAAGAWRTARSFVEAAALISGLA